MLLREAEQVLRQNLHNSKEYPADDDFLEAPAKTSPTKFILPLEDPEDFAKSSPSPVENSRADSGSYCLNSFNGSREFGKKLSERNEEDKRKFEQLKKEKKDILVVISRIKRQMAEIEIQEEELQREVRKKQRKF